MEYTAQAVLGYEIPVIVGLPARHLKLQDPRVVDQYNDLYAEFLRSEGLASCIFQLKVWVSYLALPKLEAEFDSLDRLRVEGMAWVDS